MPTPWDAYKAEVLDPARKAGDVPPEDLFVRYSITGAHRDPARFAERIGEVTGFWKTQRTVSKVYKPVVGAMLIAHDVLVREKALSWAEFERRREASRAGAIERLDARIAVIARGIPSLPKAGLAHLAAQSGGLLTEEDVRGRLAKGGVTVIDPEWDIPATLPEPSAATIGSKLRLLGLRISPQVVFGPAAVAGGFRAKDGFRLTGDSARLDGEALEKAKKEQAKRKLDDGKTAADSVLTALIRAHHAGTLDQLVRWELAELVRAELRHGLPLTVAAEAAVAAGLDRDEALEMAASLLPEAGGPMPEPDDSATVAAALAGGGLREAERLLAALPAESVTAELRDLVRATAAAVADLMARADRAEPEVAAGLLADAVRRCTDDPDLTARLDRIPPPPPGRVRVDAGGGRVSVQWEPSPAVTGQIRYRVVRAIRTGSPGSGETIEETTANHVTDAAPPAAEPLRYTVFALRGAAISSGAPAAEPVLLLPPVTGFDLGADGSAITGLWRLDPAAVAVEVTVARVDGQEHDRPVPVASGRVTGFTDTEAELGVGYAYSVRPVYIGRDGVRRTGPGTTETVVAERPPVAVEDLTAEPDGSSLRLRWTAPAGGRVEIRRSGVPPPWPVGELVPVAAVDAWGEAVSGGAAPGPDGRADALAPAGQGKVVLLAVTRGRATAVIGNTVELELAAPVTDLLVTRRGRTAQVEWLWPDGIEEARLTWSTAGREDRLEVTRRGYAEDGAPRLTCGPAAVRVAVQSVVRERNTELRATPAVAELPALRPRVEWRPRRAIGRRRLWLRADQPCRLPELLLVPGPGGGGDPVRLASRPLAAGQIIQVDMGALMTAAAFAGMRCVIADPDDTTVRLAPWTEGERR